MHITLDKNQFVRRFQSSSRANQFSREGLEAIYDYYESIGEDLELDIIGICCEWTEYDDLKELCSDYCVDTYLKDYDYDNDDDYLLDDLLTDVEGVVNTLIKLDNGNYLIETY